MTADRGEGDRAALDRILGVPELAWLLGRVRARIIDAGGAPLTGVVQLRDPSQEQRAAAAALVGMRRRPGASLRVDLADVEAILRRGPWPAGLADATVLLTGPVEDHARERERTALAWAQAEAALRAQERAEERDMVGFADWWAAWCASGGLKRTARAEAVRLGVEPAASVGADLVTQVAAVLDALPSAGEPLPVLARRIVGDSHGLDAARPLGRLAAAVVENAFAPGAGSPRDAWAAAGVVLSNVASTVLCLGVPGIGAETRDPTAHATSVALEAMRTARVPLVLTLDQARSGGVASLPPGRIVHVCENPTIVEVVAERWRAAEGDPVSLTLVCTGGQPSTAVVDLLTILTEQGAECRYHGDFDWPGLRIAQTLGRTVGWTPWRFTAADYEAVVAQGAPSRGLDGVPAESPWDPELALAMAKHGLAVEEEAVAHALAGDLVNGAVSDPRA